MATLPYICNGCSRPGEVHVGQSAYSDRLRWSESFYCAHCGAAFESDGGADAPENVRAALLAEGGTWALVVDRVPRVAMALRAVLGLTVADAVALAGRLPGEVATGTKVEVVHLGKELATHGVTSRAVLVTPGTSSA